MKRLQTLAQPAAHKALFLSFVTAVGAALSGCSTTTTFNVTSDPVQADVYYQAPDAKEKTAIGKTPFTMPMAEFRKIVGDSVKPGQFFPITVEKQGYVSQTYQIPATRFGTLVTSLDVKLKEGNTSKEEKTAKNLIEKLFLAQKFALSNQFERAQVELDRILADFPGFARALSMRASIYYAQKNLPEALKWYEEALKSDPQMDDAVKMAAKIRQAQGLGGRLPSAQAPASGAPTTSPADDKGSTQ